MKKPLLCTLYTAVFFFIAIGAWSQNLVSSEFKGQFSQAQLILQYGPLIQNGVRMYKITYSTIGALGQPDTASGLLVVPMRPGFTLPLLVCHRGTVDSPSDVPSNLAGGYQLAVVFGGLGYVTIMPDLLGMGTSQGFHPYVHRAATVSATIDMLRAAKQYAAQNTLSLNSQLFVTGYSQGGFSAMATHKAIQEQFSQEFTVTASAPMSGPYSFSGIMRDAILSDNVYLYPAYVPNTMLSYNYMYNLYNSTQAYLKEPYAAMADQYFNRQITLSQLNTMLIQRLTADFGASIPRFMLQDSIAAAVVNNPNHPVNLALADNDVFDWAPQAPTRLMYCQADDQVPYRNSVVADSIMRLNGAPNVQAINVNATANHGACVQPALFNTALFFGQYQSITVSTREQPALLPDVVISPNPAREGFWLENAPEGAWLEVFDLQGRRVMATFVTDAPQRISTQAWERGLYLLRLTAASGYWHGKVLVQP